MKVTKKEGEVATEEGEAAVEVTEVVAVAMKNPTIFRVPQDLQAHPVQLDTREIQVNKLVVIQVFWIH